jgi:K+-transporting ATPase KdpF subunit
MAATASRERSMFEYALGGAATAAILYYLIVALLRPERF